MDISARDSFKNLLKEIKARGGHLGNAIDQQHDSGVSLDESNTKQADGQTKYPETDEKELETESPDINEECCSSSLSTPRVHTDESMEKEIEESLGECENETLSRNLKFDGWNGLGALDITLEELSASYGSSFLSTKTPVMINGENGPSKVLIP